MNNFSKIPMSFQRELTNTLLEEACRQWCDCIVDAPERQSGEGFADFYHEIYSQKAAEYLATMLVDEKIESVGELFCTEQAIITLRPASADEVGLFYSQMETARDAEIATVGHYLRKILFKKNCIIIYKLGCYGKTSRITIPVYNS